MRRSELSIADILAWADGHVLKSGSWPRNSSGPVGPLGTNWRQVDNALRFGLRGLPGGSPLAQLLAEQRGVRNIRALLPLTVEQITTWAEAYYERMGSWPNENSGAIEEAAGEVWKNVDMALREGHRGLPGGSTLARLLADTLGIRNRANIPPLTVELILSWADSHFQRTQTWPGLRSGAIDDAPGETWMAVEAALYSGCRGLPAGGSLARLLAEHRQVRNNKALPPLVIEKVLAWARAHQERTGVWPNPESGPIVDAPGETWKAVQQALVEGIRGLAGGSSLFQLLHEHHLVQKRKPGQAEKPRI